MPRAKTSADLVSAIRRRAFLPDSGSLTSQELIDVANDELQSTFAEVLATGDESHGLAVLNHTLVSGTAAYLLPPRSRAGGLADVSWIRSGSSVEIPVEPIAVQDAWQITLDVSWGVRPRFYLRGDELVLVPSPTSAEAGGTLRIRYVRAQPKIVLTTAAAAIVTANAPTPPDQPLYTLTCETATVPTALDSSGGLVDIIRGDRTHQPIYTDLEVSSTTDTTTVYLASGVTIDTTLIANTSATPYGSRQDWVCEAGCTVFPAGPYEPLWPMLVDACAAHALVSLGDRDGAAQLREGLADRVARARRGLAPREKVAQALVPHVRRRRAWWGDV